jgi:hypothetical protein
MKDFLESIKSNWPKAFHYFEDYYNNDFDNRNLRLENLPFEMSVGVFLNFFTQINSDIEFYSYEKEALEDAIKEAFATYEEYLFLDS